MAVLRPVIVLARATIAEAVRDRILYGLLAFSFGLILLGAVLSNLTIGHQVRIVTNLALSTITLAGTVMSILLGISAINRETQQRTIFSIISKPIGRSQYIAGKFIGVLSTVAANVLLMTAAATLTIIQYQYVQPFQYPVDDFVAHVALLVIRLGVVVAISIAFSTIASSTVALIGTAGLTIAGYFTSDLRFFLGQSDDAFVRMVGSALYYGAPDFMILDTLPELLHGQPVLGSATIIAASYAILYATSALAFAVICFSRKDIG